MMSLGQRKSLRVAIGLVVLMAIIVVVRLRTPSELEQWKRTVRDRGEKLTLAEVAPPFSSAVRDWEANLSNAVSRLAKGPYAPALLSPMQPAGPGLAIAAWQSSSPFRPSASDDPWPEFAEQMQANEPVMAEIRDLLRRRPPGSAYDPAAPFGPSGIHLVTRRAAAQNLMGAVVNELHRGKLDAALTNLHALIALASFREESGLLVYRMIASAIAGLGINLTWEALQAPGWDDARLAALQAAWQQADLASDISKTVLAERAYALTCFELARTNRGEWNNVFPRNAAKSSLGEQVGETLLQSVWQVAWSEQDELLYLQVMQLLMAGLREAGSGLPTYSALQRSIAEGQTLLDARKGPLDRMRYQLTRMAIPNWQKACQQVWKQEAKRCLATTAIALKRHQLRHGRAPETLAALVPEFLSAVPNDPMTGQPLRYLRRDDGSVELLYSVGENGQNDEGQGDDIIWPRLAPAGEP